MSILILFFCFKYIFSRCTFSDNSKIVYDDCYKKSLSKEESSNKDDLGYYPNDCCRLFFKEKDDLCVPVDKSHIHEYFEHYGAVDGDSARCNDDKIVIFKNSNGPRCTDFDDCYKISALSDADKENNVLKQYEANACCRFNFIEEVFICDDEECDDEKIFSMCSPANKDKIKEYFEHFYFNGLKNEGFTANYAECGDGPVYYFDYAKYYKLNIGLLALLALLVFISF